VGRRNWGADFSHYKIELKQLMGGTQQMLSNRSLRDSKGRESGGPVGERAGKG